MSISTAMGTTLEMQLGEEPRRDAKWFGGGGCVVEADGQRHVFVRGVLVGSFGPKDQQMKKLLLVGLAQGEQVHLEQLSAAFGVSAGGLWKLRRVYREKGASGVLRLVQGGNRVAPDSPRLKRKLEEAFAGGATVDEAWEAIGRKAGLSRTSVGRRRQEWAAASRRATPALAVAPALQQAPLEDAVAVVATTDAAAPGPALAVVPAESPAEASEERLKGAAVETAPRVQHLGTWLLVAMVARLGLHEAAQAAAGRRVGADALRLALDAVVMALGVGQRCVEGVRRLATSTAPALLRATGMPSPSWTRRTLGRFAEDEGGMQLHLGVAAACLREAAAKGPGPVFYVDNHLRPYTGQEVIRRGWRMQDKRVRPGTSDYYVHDEDGRPVLRMASPSHESLTEWLTPIARLLRLGLGDEETILVAFDRAGAFPEQMAALREEGFEFVTYERRPYPELPDSAFTEEVTLDGETLRICDTRKNLGNARGRVRRIAVKQPDGYQLNLVATSRRSAAELLEVMSGRWRQENGFKHGVERWGINQLDGRTVQPYPPDSIIPNPARRRLDTALRVARIREGDARAALARLGPDALKRAAAQQEINEAVAEQLRLEALRPSTPMRAPLRDTELADTLVQHTIEYKLVLDTIRIACANAEAELASLLAPHLPRAAEAKKTLANLFASPGAIKAGRDNIEVRLDPAATRPERKAFEVLFAAANRLSLTLPGDQQARPLRFTLPLP